MQLKYVDTKEEIIAINRKAKHIEPHLHNALEIVCVTSGTLELGVGQELCHTGAVKSAVQLFAGELHGALCRAHCAGAAVCTVAGAGGRGSGYPADDALPVFYPGTEGRLSAGADATFVCTENALCDAHCGRPGGNSSGDRTGVLRCGGLLYHAFCVCECGDLPEQQHRCHGGPDQIYDGVHDRQ